MGHQTESHAGPWDAELVPDVGGRTRRPEPDCPVERALAAVSGRQLAQAGAEEEQDTP